MSIQDDVKQILDQKESKENPPVISKEEVSNPNPLLNNNKDNNFPYQNPFQEKKNEYKPNPLLKTLRTFHGDLEETINKNKESVVSIAVAEQKVKAEIKEKEEKAVKTGAPITRSQVVFEDKASIFKSSLSLFLALILFLGALSIFGVLYVMKSDKKDNVSVKMENSILPFTSEIEIETYNKNKENILSNLSSAKDGFKQQVNSILYTKLISTLEKNKKEILPVENFLNMLSSQAPQSLKRVFNKDDYMLGVYSFDTNEYFLILKPEDYGIAYSGMLKWESIMANDLSGLFPKAYLSGGVFEDDVYKSKDVRVLKDNQNKIVLIYGFIDRNTLLITANEKVFESLVSKYINSKIVR